MMWFDDLRLGVRGLAKPPKFTAAVVITLALGIVANAVIFTLTNELFFSQMPFRNYSIIFVSPRYTHRRDTVVPESYPDFEDWRSQATSFEGSRPSPVSRQSGRWSRRARTLSRRGHLGEHLSHASLEAGPRTGFHRQ